MGIDISTVATDLRVVIGRARRRMRETHETADFSPSQSAVIVRLERSGPSTVTALARAEGVRPQSMGATVATLIEQNYLSATPDPTDGRRTILDLSDFARAHLATSRAAKEDWLSSTISTRLTPTEQQKLADAVEILKKLVA